MSDEPNVENLQHGVHELFDAVDNLGAFASTMDEVEIGRQEHEEDSILRFCIELIQPKSAVSKLLTIQSRCHDAAKKLESHPKYEKQARYCIEASLQAAELGSSVQEFANHMKDSINDLRNRASQQESKRWTHRDEEQFWPAHYKFHHIAGIFSSSPKVPNLGESIRPVREETKADRTLREYLKGLERIPNHHRTILDRLDKMSEEMVHKHYKCEPFYSEAVGRWQTSHLSGI